MTLEATTASFDTEEGGDCPPDLYQVHEAATGVQHFEDIDDEQIARFHREGFLVIHEAFTAEEVESGLSGLHDLIEGKYPNYRGIQYEKGARQILETLSPDERIDAVRKLWKMAETDSQIAALAEHPKVLDVMRRIMQDEPQLFQDQALLKPPRIGREKPWHQDNAYFNLPPETTVVGIWIALDEAIPENGCMFVISGSHTAGPVVHFKRRDWQICDTDVAAHRALNVPLKPGGALLFHGLIHHGTPPSNSPLRRRALQFHYKPASVDQIEPSDRLAIFGSEGKDVTC